MEALPIEPIGKLYVDGSSNENRAGVGLNMASPEGHNIHNALTPRIMRMNMKTYLLDYELPKSLRL